MPEIALYVDPPSHHFRRDRLFDPSTNPLAGENILAPYLLLRERFARAGIPVHTADLLPAPPNSARNVYVSVGLVGDLAHLAARPDVVLSAFLAMECPIVEPSVFRALPRIARYVKRILCFAGGDALRPFTRERLPVQRIVWPQCFDGVHEDVWSGSDRAFLCMINAAKLPRLYHAELYTARLEAVEFFHRFGEIDLYGKGWDRMPHRVGKTWVPWTARLLYRALWEAKQRRWPDPVYAATTAAWRGTVASKAETLGRYTFAICFENMVLEGWITEKIFDCFYAGCVPVYWGAPDVTQWIPAEAFIDMRQFRDFAELRTFLHDLRPADVSRYREAARSFIESPAYDRFKPAAFAETVWQIVRQDAGLPSGQLPESGDA